MFNTSRKVRCPECHLINRWKGQPNASDELYCRYCKAFVTTYDAYIKDMVHREVTRIMVKYTNPDSDYQMDLLKGAFMHESQSPTRHV